MEQPTVGMYRIEPELVARRLRDSLAERLDATLPIAQLVLVAAVIGASLPCRDFAAVYRMVRAIVCEDYADGFVDGFGCACGQRGRGRRYVQGLDDAAALRDALRRLGADWAWMLLEQTQPRL